MVQGRLNVVRSEDLLISKGWQTPGGVIRIISTSFPQAADSLLLGVGLGAVAVLEAGGWPSDFYSPGSRC